MPSPFLQLSWLAFSTVIGLLFVACGDGSDPQPTTSVVTVTPPATTDPVKPAELNIEKVRFQDIEIDRFNCYFPDLASNAVRSDRTVGIEIEQDDLRRWAAKTADFDHHSLAALVNSMHTRLAMPYTGDGSDCLRFADSHDPMMFVTLQGSDRQRIRTLILRGCQSSLEDFLIMTIPDFDLPSNLLLSAESAESGNCASAIYRVDVDATIDATQLMLDAEAQGFVVTRSVLMGAPWEVIGGPWEVIGGPWEVIGGPWEVIGGPWEVIGGPLQSDVAIDTRDLPKTIVGHCGDYATTRWLAPWNQWALQKDRGIGVYDNTGQHVPCRQHRQSIANAGGGKQTAQLLPTTEDWLGEGVVVYILDTSPFAPSATVDSAGPFLNKWATVVAPALTTVPKLSVYDDITLPDAITISDYQCGYNPDRVNTAANHGLFIAGLVHTIAPEAEIVLVRTMNDSAQTTLETVIEALNWVDQDLKQRPQDSFKSAVVNMSFSMRDFQQQVTNQNGVMLEYSSGPNAGVNVSVLKDTIDLLQSNHNALFIGAAGNSTLPGIRPSDGFGSARFGQEVPARLTNVLAVASTNQAGALSCFSNYHEPNTLRTLFAPSGDGYYHSSDPDLSRLTVNTARDICQTVENLTCGPPLVRDDDDPTRVRCGDSVLGPMQYDCDYALTSIVMNMGTDPDKLGHPTLALGAGTSYSAALATGLATLARQVCPQLSADDVTYLLTGQINSTNVNRTGVAESTFDTLYRRLVNAKVADRPCTIRNGVIDAFVNVSHRQGQSTAVSPDHIDMFISAVTPASSQQLPVPYRRIIAKNSNSAGKVIYRQNLSETGGLDVMIELDTNYQFTIQYGQTTCQSNLGESTVCAIEPNIISGGPERKLGLDGTAYEGIAIRIEHNSHDLNLNIALGAGSPTMRFAADKSITIPPSNMELVTIPFENILSLDALTNDLDQIQYLNLQFNSGGPDPDEVHTFTIKEIYLYGKLME